MLTAASIPERWVLQLVLHGFGGRGCLHCLLGRCLLGRRGRAGRLLVLLDEVDDLISRPASIVGGDLPAGGHEVHGWVALDVKLAGHVVRSGILETGLSLTLVQFCSRNSWRTVV